MAENLPPLPSEVVRSRVAEARKRHQWSQARLAEQMQTLGYFWDRSTVAKIETDQRQVTIDEMVALAAALGVPLLWLMCPNDESPYALGPEYSIDFNPWGWMAGDKAMRVGVRADELTPDDPDGEWVRRHYEDACPDAVVVAERRVPGIRHAERTLKLVREYCAKGEGEFSAESAVVVELIEDLRQEVAALHTAAKRQQRRAGKA